MRTIYRKFQSLDKFGTPIQLRFDNQSKNKTLFGGIYTAAMYTIILYSLALNGEELIYQSKPYLVQTQEIFSDDRKISIDERNMNIHFQINNQNKNLTIKHLVHLENVIIQAKMRKTTLDEISGYYIQEDIPLDIEECSFDQSFYCIQKESYLQVQPYLTAEMIDKEFSVILIKILKCPENNNNQYQCKNPNPNLNHLMVTIRFKDVLFNCKKKKFQKLLIQYFQFFLLYPLFQIQIVHQFQQPFQIYSRKLDSQSNIEGFKKTILNVRFVQLKTDQGIYFQDVNVDKNQFVSRVEDKYEQNPIDSNQEQFHQILIKYDGNILDSFTRSYKQIQDLLGELGGVLKIMLLFGGLICKPISQLDMKKKIVNKLYKFNIGDNFKHEFELDSTLEKQKQKMMNNQEDIDVSIEFDSEQIKKADIGSPIKFNKQNVLGRRLKLNNEDIAKRTSFIANKLIQDIAKDQDIESMMSFHDVVKTKKQTLSKKTKIFQSIFNFTKHVIRITRIQYALYYLFPLGRVKRKKILLQHAYDNVSLHLDTVYIMKKLHQIDQIQLLLLNEQQLNLFQYMPAPVIDADSLFQKEHNVRPRSRKEALQSENHIIEEIAQNRVNFAYFDSRTELHQATDAYKALKQTKEQDNYTQLDEKLVCFLDPVIMQMFQQDRKMKGSRQKILNEEDSQADFFNYDPDQVCTPINNSKKDISFFSKSEHLNFEQIKPQSQTQIILPHESNLNKDEHSNRNIALPSGFNLQPQLATTSSIPSKQTLPKAYQNMKSSQFKTHFEQSIISSDVPLQQLQPFSLNKIPDEDVTINRVNDSIDQKSFSFYQ